MPMFPKMNQDGLVLRRGAERESREFKIESRALSSGRAWSVEFCGDACECGIFSDGFGAANSEQKLHYYS